MGQKIKGLFRSVIFTWRAILVARQTAYFGHHFHEGLHILQDGALKLHRKEQDDEEISAKMFVDKDTS